MKKTLITSTVLLLLGVLLLAGCTKNESSSTSGEETDSSLTSSENSVSDGSSESSSVSSSSESTSSTESSSEQSSDVSAVPMEFTDEDREVQEILRNMENIYHTVSGWCIQGRPDDETAKEYLFLFPEFKHSSFGFGMQSSLYYEIPSGYSENGMVIPQTYNDFKNVLLSFLSEQYVEAEANVAKCSMTEITGDSFTELDEKTNGELSSYTENCDGAFFVTFETRHNYFKFIEIDGKMYRSCGEGGKGIDGVWAVNPDTVKVISRTNDAIEFSFLTAYWFSFDEDGNPLYLDDEKLYKEHAKVGVLKYERGGWKRDWDKADKERYDAWQERLREQNGTAE